MINMIGKSAMDQLHDHITDLESQLQEARHLYAIWGSMPTAEAQIAILRADKQRWDAKLAEAPHGP